MSPFRMLYGKQCHLSVEIEHRAYWTLRALNYDLDVAGEKRKLQLNELDELRSDAYDLAKDYKTRTKLFHDSKIVRRDFTVGQKVWLYQTKLHLHPGKLRSRWTGPFVVHRIKPGGSFELMNPTDNSIFTANGHRLKPYIE